MVNPWLAISEADYVGHMDCPNVNQRPVLNRLLREALEETQPSALLVLACSTGNGFEHVDPARTRRVVGLDLNPTFFENLRRRFPDPGFEIGLRCVDVAECTLPTSAGRRTQARRDGVVLQRPSGSSPAVTPTAFESLRSPEFVFHL